MTIGRHVKNSKLRAQLITSAMSVIHHVKERISITKKDVWLKSLIERCGKKCAAVALANKTVRTAYTMLIQNTEYTAEILPA